MSTETNSTPLAILVADMSLILGRIVEAGGELTPELEAAFDNVGSQLQEKADSYAFFMDRLDAEAEFWKQKAESYSRVSKSCKALRERLNDSIKSAMQVLNTDEIQGVDMRFKLSRAAPKLIIDEAFLPSSFKMQVIETVPDKTKIKNALEVGTEIPGVKQESVFTLRKYINSKKGN